jgi:two-component system, chemotaxis family, CheB/CheR fusion protein
LAALLRTQGHVPLTATDGPSALALLARRTLAPDVLIMDFKLPGEMGGADVAQEICRSLGHVVPTGDTTSAMDEQCRAGPALRLVRKPVAADELLTTLRELLS